MTQDQTNKSRRSLDRLFMEEEETRPIPVLPHQMKGEDVPEAPAEAPEEALPAESAPETEEAPAPEEVPVVRRSLDELFFGDEDAAETPVIMEEPPAAEEPMAANASPVEEQAESPAAEESVSTEESEESSIEETLHPGIAAAAAAASVTYPHETRKEFIRRHVSAETRAMLDETVRMQPVDEVATSQELRPVENPEAVIAAEAPKTRTQIKAEKKAAKKAAKEAKKARYAEKEAEEAEEKKEAGGIKDFFLGWVLPIAAALILAVIIRTFIGGATTVRGSSMEPTLHDGNVLLVSKIPTYFKSYKRGDILIIDSPDQVELYVKRLIGLPGETVAIKNGKIIIDGKWEMDEMYTDEETAVYQDAEWTLGPDEYFVMGDNRESGASNDSRIFGPIAGEEIEAVSRLRVWPLNQFKPM